MSPHVIPQCCIPSSAGGSTAAPHLLSSVIRNSRPGTGNQSPLDRAYDGFKALTKVTHSLSSDWAHQHGSMLAAAAVAAVEDYFRTIFVEIAMICPFAVRQSNGFATKVMFVETGSREQALRSTLELVSFSSTENIDDWCSKLVGLKASKDPSLNPLMRDFEGVCHLRHCITHAGGYVSVNNSSALQASPGSWVSIDSTQNIHQIIAVLTRLLRAFNQWLFSAVLNRWINEATLTGEWNEDRELFATLWSTFASSLDINTTLPQGETVVPSNAYFAYRKIQANLRSRAGT